MTVAKLMAKCPFCLEPIISGASRCKHCQADLSASKKKKPLSRYNTFRSGFVAGVLFSLILGLLMYGHLFWGQ